MIVCVCRRVSDREIARHVRAGMSFDEVQFELVAALSRETNPRAIQLANSIKESNAWNSSQHSAAV